jgi:hypothetical protein
MVARLPVQIKSGFTVVIYDMNVPYAKHSTFTDTCGKGIAGQREALEGGKVVTVQLPPKGYKQCVTIIIDSHNADTFDSEPAPKRFPSRIKAAATALQNCACVGRFIICHENGTLTVQKS